MTILTLLGMDPVDLRDDQLMEAIEVVNHEMLDAYNRAARDETAVGTFVALDAYVSWLEEEIENRCILRGIGSRGGL